MKKRTMQPTEHAEYRLPQDFCCANKTVLNCPSSSADKFYVYYNFKPPFFQAFKPPNVTKLL